MSHARAIRLKLRIERRHRKDTPRITRTIEQDRSRQRYTVVRVNGWAV
jgi:hypothetical protein